MPKSAQHLCISFTLGKVQQLLLGFSRYVILCDWLGSAPLPHLPNHPPRFKQRAIKKTILIANLSSCDSNRPSTSRAGRLVHTVVTQVIISLDSNDCSVTRATECVRKQIGLDVVLLDSKLFPIMDNESTSGAEFWHSTRKIIAVSCASYERLSGIAAGEELCQVEGDVRQSASKKPKSYNISENFEVLNKKLKILECMICKSVVESPIMSKYYQRIIECRACVMTWPGTSTGSPLCSVSGRINDVLELNDVTSLLHTGDDDTKPTTVAGDKDTEPITIAVDTEESTDDDFEELPNFSAPTSQCLPLSIYDDCHCLFICCVVLCCGP